MFLSRDKHREGGENVAPKEAGVTDEALAAAARELREDAWTEIYSRHAEQVYAYIYYRIGDRHTAEDLTADVFVRAIAGISKYEWRGTPLLAWLYRIAHNTTIDHRKQLARKAARESQAELEEVEERIDVLAATDDRSDMMKAIRMLTDDQQQVLILRFYRGLTNAEVSAVVGKPETAVKALQARGLRSLRRFLQEESRQTA